MILCRDNDRRILKVYFMEIEKSTRHQKIIGNFGESLVCNWLSRSGFEVTIVDHTGIDVLAYNSKTGERIGISVKSRTRVKGSETESVNILSYRKEKNDRDKVFDACKAFEAKPWIAVYVESTDCADLFLISLKHYDRKYRGKTKRVIDTWKLGPKDMKKYKADRNVKHIQMNFIVNSWQWS